jgi:hypothetical protein
MGNFFDTKLAKGLATGMTAGTSDLYLGYGLGADEAKYQASKASNGNGVLGGASDMVFGKDTTPQFQAPELTQGTAVKADAVKSNYESAYNPTAYNGQFDAAGGGTQLNNLEKTLGVQGFDGNQFRSAQSAAIDSQVARNTAASQRVNDQNAMSSGLGNSGMNRALDQLARSEGDAAGIQAKAALEGQVAGMQQNENQFRTGTAMSAAGQQLQNTQFGAGLTEQQAQFAEGANQFGAGLDLQAQSANQGANLQAAGLNEGMRQYDESAKYGTAQDSYNLNQIAPKQRADQRSGALLQAGTSLVGGAMSGGASAAGAILPVAAAACWIAEAIYGAQDQRTHQARYAVNVIWPEYAIGRFLRNLYLKYGQRVAAKVEKSRVLKALFGVPFGFIHRQGAKAMEAK